MTDRPWPGWGPAGRRAAVSITFDNLGEAMDISLGTWGSDREVGKHYSVHQVLPRILEMLDELHVRSTYFVEGWGAQTYPDAVAGLLSGGHEVGYHGWLHEHWSGLTSREQERDLLTRGVEALSAQGVTVRGFRPPGGLMTPWTASLMEELSLTYVSPAGSRAGTVGRSLVALPFEWLAIDAYYLFDAFAPLRLRRGDPAGRLSPDVMAAAMRQAVDRTVETGGSLALLFHPFLMNTEESFAAMRDVIAFVLGHPDVWCARCDEQVDWMLGRRESLPPAELDERSWR